MSQLLSSLRRRETPAYLPPLAVRCLAASGGAGSFRSERALARLRLA
jgi:hypothetical protein